MSAMAGRAFIFVVVSIDQQVDCEHGLQKDPLIWSEMAGAEAPRGDWLRREAGQNNHAGRARLRAPRYKPEPALSS